MGQTSSGEWRGGRGLAFFLQSVWDCSCFGGQRNTGFIKCSGSSMHLVSGLPWESARGFSWPGPTVTRNCASTLTEPVGMLSQADSRGSKLPAWSNMPGDTGLGWLQIGLSVCPSNRDWPEHHCWCDSPTRGSCLRSRESRSTPIYSLSRCLGSVTVTAHR